MENSAVIVFSGFNQRGVIAFLRVATSKNISTHIISSAKNDPISLTEYKNIIFAERKFVDFDIDEVLPILQMIKREYGYSKLHILPSSEYLNRKFLSERQLFESEGIFMPIVDKELYSQLSDKFRFRNHCENHGLLAPPEVGGVADELPIVVKPKSYFSPLGKVQFKPKLIHTESELSNLLDDQEVEDFYFERFIYGESYYLLFYFAKNKEVISFSQKNLIQQPGGGSIVAAQGAEIHESEIARKFEEMLLSAGFQGLIMIEIRDAKEGQFVIEANPRLWGPSQLFVDADIPIFDRLLSDLGLLSEREKDDQVGSNTEPGFVKYFWSGGFGRRGLNDPKLAFHGTNQEDFARQYGDFQSIDVYRRPDTISIFREEAGGEN